VCVCVCIHAYRYRCRDTIYTEDIHEYIKKYEYIQGIYSVGGDKEDWVRVCIYIYVYIHVDRDIEMRGCTGWRRYIGCLKLQVSFRTRATNHRALLRKMMDLIEYH